MDTSALATTISARLPDWVLTELDDVDGVLGHVDDRMRLAHRLATRNYREGTGGPFAAVVSDADTGALLSVGVNLVLGSGLSSLHAEVVALSLAQARVGGWDLGAPERPPVEIAVNWRPCVMCYGAVMWSGVERLVIAGEGPDVERLTGFDEGPMREDWQQQFADRGITVVTDVLREEAIATFEAFGDSDAVVYNGRQRQKG